MDSIRTKNPPDVWAAASRTDQLPSHASTHARSQQDAASLSTSSIYNQELEKQVVPTAAPSGLARLNPRTWSRKMRLFALIGLFFALLGIASAIAVPLSLEHLREQDAPTKGDSSQGNSQGKGAQAEPLFSNPPNTSVLADDIPLRIMPLGASITFGFLSTDGNGYREDLLGLLQQGGNKDITYVGSRNNGTMALNAVEGWPGLRIDEVLPKARESVPRFLPNVVLLNVGTNDCVQDFDMDKTNRESPVSPELTANATYNVGERLRLMIEDVFTMAPSTTVVLSTLILNKNETVNARVNDANTQYRAVAQSLKAAGRRVVLAEMSADAGGPNSNTMADNTHPNDVGYSLMANRWYEALQEAGNQGLIVAPPALA